jgi:hypothetical protein
VYSILIFVLIFDNGEEDGEEDVGNAGISLDFGASPWI